MSTDNPTHAELVASLLDLASCFDTLRTASSRPAASAFQRNSNADARDLIPKAASFIESQASRIEELDADNKRQTEALQAIDRIVEDNIKDNGTDINRMNIDGEWFTGPPVDACFRILRAFQEVARAALGDKP